MYTIYSLTDDQGRQYIGCTAQALDARLRNHETLAARYIHPDSLGAAIVRKGIGAFSAVVIGTCSTLAEAAEAERREIAARGTMHPHGYNMRRGGAGFGRHTKRLSRHPVQRCPLPALTAAAPPLPRVGAAATPFGER